MKARLGSEQCLTGRGQPLRAPQEATGIEAPRTLSRAGTTAGALPLWEPTWPSGSSGLWAAGRGRCGGEHVLRGQGSPPARPSGLAPVLRDPPPTPLLLSREAPAHIWLWPQPLHPQPYAPPPTKVAASTRGGDVPHAHIRSSTPLGTDRRHRDTPQPEYVTATLFHAKSSKMKRQRNVFQMKE